MGVTTGLLAIVASPRSLPIDGVDRSADLRRLGSLVT
jgi:hypothetical protein